MDKQTPTRRPKQKNPSQPQNEVEAPATEAETPSPIMKRSKIGEPTIGRSPDYVKTIGLGNLTVITANGKRTNSESN